MTTTNPVPAFYRVLFTFIDPIFCLMGLGLHLFDPTNTLRGYSPSFLNPPTIETVHLLDSMAGFFAMLAVLEGVLLRARSTDVAVWRIFQASASLLDILMVFGAVRALTVEGRLDWRVWRGDDWRLVVGNAAMGLARVACAFGIGMRSEGKSKRVWGEHKRQRPGLDNDWTVGSSGTWFGSLRDRHLHRLLDLRAT